MFLLLDSLGNDAANAFTKHGARHMVSFVGDFICELC